MKSNAVKGAEYELQVVNYLQSLGIVCWLWRFVPETVLEMAGIITDYDRVRLARKRAFADGENPLQDVGCDIVTQDADDVRLVQCKNYTGTICQSDLAGLYRMQLYFDRPGDVYYSGKLSRVVRETPAAFDRTKYINLPYVDPDSASEPVTKVRSVLLLCSYLT